VGGDLRGRPLGLRIGSLTREAAEALGLPAGSPIGEGGVGAHEGLLGLNALESSKVGLITGSSKGSRDNY